METKVCLVEIIRTADYHLVLNCQQLNWNQIPFGKSSGARYLIQPTHIEKIPRISF
jgi:hypothetical protein